VAAQLPDDVWNQELLERQWFGLIAREHPIYPALVSLLRANATMTGATNVALRIKHYLRYCLAQGINPVTATRDDLEGWLSSMRHLAPITRQAYIAMAKNLYEELIDRDLVIKNPARRLHVGRNTRPAVRALTLEEVERTLDGIRVDLTSAHALRQLTAARDYLLFSIAVTFGPRAREIRRLEFGDFNVESERPTAAIFGKFQKHDIKRLAPIVVEALAFYRSVLERTIKRELEADDAVFIPLSHNTVLQLRAAGERRLRPMSQPALYSIVRNRLRDAGIDGEKLGSHRLRKTAATLAWRATKDIEATSRMLSHSRPDITWKYYIASEENLDESPSLQIPLRPTGLTPVASVRPDEADSSRLPSNER